MGRPALIHKSPADLAVPPNLADYAATCRAFSWDAARREMAGLPGGGLNIAFEAVDHHAQGPLAGHVAFRFLGSQAQRDISFSELSVLTNRFANVLKTLGVQRGERVFGSCTQRCWEASRTAAWFRHCSPPSAPNRWPRA